jgi:O-acetyl-ADP-ribose deacetylase (regulator of RNase III)
MIIDPATLDRIVIQVGDLTQVKAQAIVNAANESLLGGGGVDGAIHRAAGPRLLQHNRTLGGCPTGLARITPSFDLQARGIAHILHTVGPVWQAGDPQQTTKLGDLHEDVLLASCYHQCLTLAREHDIRTLAFPAISTGVYRFPKPRAAKIALGHTLGWLLRESLPQAVIFCCFNDEDAAIYRQTLDDREQWLAAKRRGTL